MPADPGPVPAGGLSLRDVVDVAAPADEADQVTGYVVRARTFQGDEDCRGEPSLVEDSEIEVTIEPAEARLSVSI